LNHLNTCGEQALKSDVVRPRMTRCWIDGPLPPELAAAKYIMHPQPVWDFAEAFLRMDANEATNSRTDRHALCPTSSIGILLQWILRPGKALADCQRA